MLQNTVSHQKENVNNIQEGNFELLPCIEKQQADCDLFDTIKGGKLVGSERLAELMKRINLNHLDN